MRARAIASVAAACAVGAVPALGSTAPGGVHAAAHLNACKLLKTAEVAKAIGEPVAKRQGGGSSTGARFCNWYGKDSHILQRGVSLIAAHDNAKQRYKGYKKLMHHPHKVSGIGDAAATDGDALIVRKGNNRFLQISPLYKGAGVTVDTLKPLAVKALKRIK